MKETKVVWLSGHKLEFQEDDFDRKFDIYIQEPDDINENTGVFIILEGLGGLASSPAMNEIRKSWSNKYNVIAVGVNYLGSRSEINKVDNVIIDNELLSKFEKIMTKEQISHFLNRPDKSIMTLLDYFPNQDLLSKGIIVKTSSNYNPNRALIRDYKDFGYIQAIDPIYALKYILDNYKVNKNRIFIYGVSYGGYIAQMVAKFAPSSFSLVADLSGYALAEKYIVYPQVVRSFTDKKTLIGKVEESFYSMPSAPPPSNKFAFTDDMYEIRKLATKHHIKNFAKHFTGKIFMFHSINDPLIKVETKKELEKMYKDFNIDCTHYLFDKSHIDGEIIKTDGHCMNADVKKLFEKYLSDVVNQEVSSNDKNTDFDIKHSITYSCKKQKYVIDYSKEYPIIYSTKK